MRKLPIHGARAVLRWRRRGVGLATAPWLAELLDPTGSTSSRIDETDVKVRGKWTDLYRAVDRHGNTIDVDLLPTRNTSAAKRFLGKALNGLKDWKKPEVINTDKAPTDAAALAEPKKRASVRRLRCIDRSST